MQRRLDREVVHILFQFPVAAVAVAVSGVVVVFVGRVVVIAVAAGVIRAVAHGVVAVGNAPPLTGRLHGAWLAPPARRRVHR